MCVCVPDMYLPMCICVYECVNAYVCVCVCLCICEKESTDA